MKIVTRKTQSLIAKDITKLKKRLSDFPEEALDKFKELTPIDTGNARRNTTLKNKKTIVADYPYAGRLNDGWSKQAPKGIVRPFFKWLRQRSRMIFKRN
jgi:hypothetical protein